MKTPKIVFKHNVLKNELKNSPYRLNSTQAKKRIKDAIALAEIMAARGHTRVNNTLDERTRNRKKSAWKKDKTIVDYFGSRLVTVPAMQGVGRRLDRARRRLAERSLTVRVFPQSKAPSPSTLAQNLGSVFSAKTFKVFSSWFRQSARDRAAIIIHELNHDLFVDQKIRDGRKRVTVYGQRLAKKLAKEKPASARRSAENYEQFCKSV